MILSQQQPDGCTLRHHLQSVARATKRIPDELRVTPIPHGCESLAATFAEIRSQTRPVMAGPVVISLSDVSAWQECYGVRLTPWEISTIMEMSQAVAKATNG